MAVRWVCGMNRERCEVLHDRQYLLRRAAELTERADHEENIETRERLLRMAHPTSRSLKVRNGWLRIQPLSLL
jgi:hypothetical protein